MNIFSPMVRHHPGLFRDIVNNIPNPIPSSVMDTPNMDVVGKHLYLLLITMPLFWRSDKLMKRQVDETTIQRKLRGLKDPLLKHIYYLTKVLFYSYCQE